MLTVWVLSEPASDDEPTEAATNDDVIVLIVYRVERSFRVLSWRCESRRRSPKR